ncbi:MAG: hypothetical protein ACK5TK_13565 [Betaproteobacteria bacterium]
MTIRASGVGGWGRASLGIVAVAAVLLLFSSQAVAQGASRNLAPGFSALPKNATLLIAPPDVELFSVSAGGVLEPRADWTAAAQKHMKEALEKFHEQNDLKVVHLSDKDADDNGELLSLYAAVARSISLHHAGPAAIPLPTKEGKLEWSFGDAMRPLQDKSGARYALFTFIRDSYTSAERVAVIVVMAVLGVGVGGGAQVGYASLVDLETGQVLWFNQLFRASGDMREPEKAAETVGVLLSQFPAGK